MSTPPETTLAKMQFRHIEAEVHGRGLVVAPTAGVLAQQADIEAFRKEMSDVVKSHPSEVYVLNLQRVGFISSAFLGMMVELNKKFRAAQAHFRICHLQPGIARVLKASKLDTLMDIRTDVKDALHL